MTDFIDTLEQQLIAAHGERPRRRLTVPWRGGAALVAAAAAVGAVVILVVALASPDPRGAATQPPVDRAVTPFPGAGSITVAVLNGTTTTGVARAAADRLAAAGFRRGVLSTDSTNQQRQRSTVYYEEGLREAARSVAGTLDIGLDRVLPMGPNARVVADRATIAVFLGADAVP